MSEKSDQSRSTIACPTPLVLFGIDSRGKPKAARFGKQHASLARKAATQLQLNVLASNDPNVADLAARLPVGRIHATGRTFVPFIRRDLYDKLIAAAANGSGGAASRSGGSSGASDSTPGGSAPHPPQNGKLSTRDLVDPNQVVTAYQAARRGERRHAHIALARQPTGAPDRASSTSAWIALSEAQTDSREWEISESLKPGKAQQTSRSKSCHHRPLAAQGLGRDRYQSSRVGQRRQPMGGMVGSDSGREGR